MTLFSWIGRWLRPRGRREAQKELIALRMDAIRAVVNAAPGTVAEPEAAAPSPDRMRSAVRKGFNATQPVTHSAQLHGRAAQLETLTEGVLDRGNHALIYGPRGSGKTSLVRVFANMADDRGHIVLYAACEPDQNFGELILSYIEALSGGKATLPSLDRPVAPRDVIDLIAEHAQRNHVFILDEFDRITDTATQHDVARLMKMLSDASIPVHIVAVGIASGLDTMLEGHESLRRHMSVVPVPRIESQAVFDLIARGAATVGVGFTDASRETIAHLSCGSPYHVRLFCALSCFEVIRRHEVTVDLPATLAGVARGVNDWALTNAEDAALFRKLISISSSYWPPIEKIARAAAQDGSLSRQRLAVEDERTGKLIDLLSDALTVDADGDRVAFRDSLAPQYLLAMLFVTENSDKIDGNIVSITDLPRHSIAQ